MNRRMRDAEVVASVVAGDLAGLAEAYDRYADPLYAYCWFMLDDSVDARDAVQDTFLIAASRLGKLRNPQYRRPWLYAVARNECLRQLSARQAASFPAEGLLAEGQSVQVTVTVESVTPGFFANLMVSPGGQTVTVVYRFGHG
jgi:DNA-directed RNA polymerase specialized sigma24 family protein